MDTDQRKYQPVAQRPRQELEEMLRSDAAGQIIAALLSATYHDPDGKWVQSQCLASLKHADLWVRRNAATCLGLLAVFHGRLDVDLVVPALRKAGEDLEVLPWVETSLSDIHHNTKPQ